MKKRTFLLGGVAILAAAGIVAATRGGLWSGGAEAQAPRPNAPRAVPIEAAAAVKNAKRDDARELLDQVPTGLRKRFGF